MLVLKRGGRSQPENATGTPLGGFFTTLEMPWKSLTAQSIVSLKRRKMLRHAPNKSCNATVIRRWIRRISLVGICAEQRTPAARILIESGITKDQVIAAIDKIRGKG